MDNRVLAYLAGCMDSDGWFGIKRNTYRVREIKDAKSTGYSERTGLKQVTEVVPKMLKEAFGGHYYLMPARGNSKPIWTWDATDKCAAKCALALLPYLRIKMAQARLLLDLRKSKDSDDYKKLSYWFALENPNWKKMPMLTFRQAAELLGYGNGASLSQAVANGTLLALPRKRVGLESPRVPAALVEALVIHKAGASDNRGRLRPPQLIAWRQRLWEECRQLNRIGTGKHPITERTGFYAPK